MDWRAKVELFEQIPREYEFGIAISSHSLWPDANQSLISLVSFGRSSKMPIRAAAPSNAREMMEARWQPGGSLSGMMTTSRPRRASV